MAQAMPTIAVLSSSPALTSILGATLRREHRWRVREFRDSRALNAYMRIAPLAVLVSDYELGRTTAAEIAMALRADEMVVSRDLQIIALSRCIDRGMRERCREAGIHEVLAKPMSPLYLEERIRERLKSVDGDGSLQGVPQLGGKDNVIPFLSRRARREQDLTPDG